MSLKSVTLESAPLPPGQSAREQFFAQGPRSVKPRELQGPLVTVDELTEGAWWAAEFGVFEPSVTGNSVTVGVRIGLSETELMAWYTDQFGSGFHYAGFELVGEPIEPAGHQQLSPGRLHIATPRGTRGHRGPWPGKSIAWAPDGCAPWVAFPGQVQGDVTWVGFRGRQVRSADRWAHDFWLDGFKPDGAHVVWPVKRTHNVDLTRPGNRSALSYVGSWAPLPLTAADDAEPPGPPLPPPEPPVDAAERKLAELADRIEKLEIRLAVVGWAPGALPAPVAAPATPGRSGQILITADGKLVFRGTAEHTGFPDTLSSSVIRLDLWLEDPRLAQLSFGRIGDMWWTRQASLNLQMPMRHLSAPDVVHALWPDLTLSNLTPDSGC